MQRRVLIGVGAIMAVVALLSACEPGPTEPMALWTIDPTYSGAGDLPTVAIIGDSITVLSHDALHAELDPDFGVRIQAVVGLDTTLISGEREYDVVTDLAATDPDIVVINLGTNDGGRPVEEILQNIAAIRARFSPTTCYVPVTISTVGTGGFTAISALAPEINSRLPLDHRADWSAAIAADPSLVPDQGVHPYDAGQKKLAEIYKSAIDTCGPRPPHDPWIPVPGTTIPGTTIPDTTVPDTTVPDTTIPDTTGG